MIAKDAIAPLPLDCYNNAALMPENVKLDR